jgi:ArsR family transcriptional regulator, arsenate/arsenite/antimonite-responsive transcriptional repressor
MVTSVLKSVLQDISSNSDEPHRSSDEAREGEAGAGGLQRLPEETGQDLVQLFKLLSDETRLRILYFLMQQEELNVRTLCDLLEQSQPAVSHHLALLRVAGIIECRRDGKHNFYHLVPKRFQHFLDMLFNVHDGQPRRVRIDNASLTYAHDGETRP